MSRRCQGSHRNQGSWVVVVAAAAAAVVEGNAVVPLVVHTVVLDRLRWEEGGNVDVAVGLREGKKVVGGRIGRLEGARSTAVAIAGHIRSSLVVEGNSFHPAAEFPGIRTCLPLFDFLHS